MGESELLYKQEAAEDRAYTKKQCMFVVPESLLTGEPQDAGNILMKHQLEAIAEVSVYSQTEIDLGTWNPSEFDLIVFGTDNTTAWAGANIDDMITLPTPKVCVTSDVAVILGIGTAGGATAAQTGIYINNVMNRALKKAQIYVVGNQVVLSAAHAMTMLNMSDSVLAEELIAVDVVGSVNDNTKTVVGYVPKYSRTGDVNSGVVTSELPGSTMYVAYAEFFVDATALGKHLFEELAKMLIYETASLPSVLDRLCGREITGNTGLIAAGAETICSAAIGQDGKRSQLLGGIIRGVQTLGAGKKAITRVYKYNGATWDLVDKYDTTTDSGLEINLGMVAHHDFVKVSVEHDAVANKTFYYTFILRDLEV